MTMTLQLVADTEPRINTTLNPACDQIKATTKTTTVTQIMAWALKLALQQQDVKCSPLDEHTGNQHCGDMMSFSKTNNKT